METAWSSNTSRGKGGTALDHVVQGFVTVRLIDPPEWAAGYVKAALGPSRGLPGENADLTIRFVDSIPAEGRLHFAEINGSPFAYDDLNFYLLDRAGRRAMLDVGRIGSRCEMVCERGISEIPLLVPLVAMWLLNQGYVMLHASSFVYRGRGILVAGWQSGGKSEMLLAFMKAGARFVSDDWTILAPGGDGMFGLSQRVGIWGWQFRYLPEYWALISRQDRARVRLADTYRALNKKLSTGKGAQRFAGRLLHRALGDPAGSGRVEVDAGKLTRDGVWQGPAPLDVVFLAGVADGAVGIDPISTEEVADRMIASQSYERRDLWEVYDRFRFAFPGKANPLFDGWRERERSLLAEALSGRPAYRLLHPYPVDLDSLYEATATLCAATATRRSAEADHAVPESALYSSSR